MNEIETKRKELREINDKWCDCILEDVKRGGSFIVKENDIESYTNVLQSHISCSILEGFNLGVEMARKEFIELLQKQKIEHSNLCQNSELKCYDYKDIEWLFENLIEKSLEEKA